MSRRKSEDVEVENTIISTVLPTCNGENVLRGRTYSLALFRNNIKSSKNMENKIMKDTNEASDIMWPIICFLKFSGHSALAYVHSEAGPADPESKIKTTWPSRKYKIKFKSYSFLWSALIAIWTIYELLISEYEVKNAHDTRELGAFEVSLGKDRKVKHTEALLLLASSIIRVLVVVIQASELILAWQESSSLAKFLNSFSQIQQELYTTFPYLYFLGPHQHSKLNRTRNILIVIYVVIPTLVLVPLFVFVFGVTPFFPTVLKSLTKAWHLFAVSLMEDVKVYMTYQILADEFSQIREGILHSIKFDQISSGKIKSWSRLVQSVRVQVNRAGESQKYHQLLLIGGSVILITVLMFALLNSPWGAPGTWGLGILGVGFLTCIIGRVYFKITGANAITKEECLIANELIFINTDDNDLRISTEIKFLHDLITLKPSVISFGSYIELNKRLILTVTSQVVTYLIVLMQFVNPK